MLRHLCFIYFSFLEFISSVRKSENDGACASRACMDAPPDPPVPIFALDSESVDVMEEMSFNYKEDV